MYMYLSFLSNNKLEVIVSLLQLKGVIYSCYAFEPEVLIPVFLKMFPFHNIFTVVFSGSLLESRVGQFLFGTVFIHIVKHLYLPSLLPELNTSHDQSLW